MHKKLITVGLGIALLASPLLASAQTSTSDNSSVIASLEALVVTLTQELQQLIAARSVSTLPAGMTIAPAPVGTPTAPIACMNYEPLNKGDTDATTGGEVSQLQQFLGMPNVTGYYGAQTAIAYQNKCGNLGNSQPTSVAGMSQYIDPGFGFSFWYPSGWQITTLPISSNDNAVGSIVSGDSIIGEIEVNASSPNAFIIYEINSPSSVIRGFDHLGSIRYSLDSGEWMVSDDDNEGDVSNTRPADISTNTMGGLHMLSGGSAFVTDIIPLSAQHFLVLSFGGGDSATGSLINPLATTIVATNPAVAVPVSTAQQTASIQAEASAYGANTSNSSPSISITSPAGASSASWIQNTTATWTWASYGNIPYVDIYLGVGNTNYPFAISYPNNGSFQWKVGAIMGNWSGLSVIPNGTYTIIVCPSGVATTSFQCGKVPVSIGGTSYAGLTYQINSISPAIAAIGSTVTISGANFDQYALVSLANQNGGPESEAVINPISITPTTITFVVPATNNSQTNPSTVGTNTVQVFANQGQGGGFRDSDATTLNVTAR